MKNFLFLLINLILPYSLFPIEDLKFYFKDYNKKYIIFIEKEKKQLSLINSDLKIVKTYQIATGINDGPKLFEGDNRTPEGEYKIIEILSYKKPFYLKEKELKNEIYSEEYKNNLEEYEKNKQKLKKMNDVYLKASDGHKKFLTGEDLGYNSYGTVFIRINYPNKKDLERYEKAKKQNMIPKNKNGEFKKPGSGIAIHGTNDEPSIGYNASSGCIRMKNKDIEELLDYIEKGIKVIIQ